MKSLVLFVLFSIIAPAFGQKMIAPDSLELTELIYKKIVQNSPEITESEMKPLISEVPKSKVKFEMIPIPAGEYVQGSSDGEEDEGPSRTVSISPFWIGKFEITWDEYEPYIGRDTPMNQNGMFEWREGDPLEDMVSGPSDAGYTEMSFGMGINGFPAICMSQHAALKYCEWLSAQTGNYYRLPTEAEWEYACRAGTKTKYSWGDDPKLADEYAWFYANAKDKYHPVGRKKPNPWGLYDMHGNVLEWTLDYYYKDAYQRSRSELMNDPYEKPPGPVFPRSIRGGSWYDYVEDLRSAKRYKSHPSWNRSDWRQLGSPWYEMDAPWLGFRIVRPLTIPELKTMHEIWNSGLETEKQR